MLDLTSLLNHSEITFELIWALFPPNEVIFAPHHGHLYQDQALCLSTTSYEKRQNGSRFFNVCGKIISHDGRRFGWGILAIEIDEYEGARKITSLPVHPLHFQPDMESMKRQLIARGRRYIQIIQSPVCQEYTASLALKSEYLMDGNERSYTFAVRILLYI